ncbi:MAG: transglutaminase-like domain-containing protein, partial [Planctomycetaceae bacterium]
KLELPELPCEFSVAVKVTEADGAAGVVFRADGERRHYGFYPSSGNLRLTRFDGPTVYEWNVLRDEFVPGFDPDGWNDLKVRLRPDGFDCYCNDELVFASDDTRYSEGGFGLVKFRHTTAEFKRFRIGRELSSLKPAAEIVAEINSAVAEIDATRPPRDELVSSMLTHGAGTGRVLEERAAQLEQQAERLRQLAGAVHVERVRQQLAEELTRPGDEIDLLRACLLIAAIDDPEVDIESYRRIVDAMAQEFAGRVDAESTEAERFGRFQEYVFDELGFHGGRTNYYSAENSYINQVIDDREGLPITLSVLYMELARRCGFDVVGIGLPGHFVTQYRPVEGEPRLIDPFERGAVLTELEATLRVHGITGLEWNDRYLEPQSPRAIVTRMLRNLLGFSNAEEEPEQALRYVETLLALDPESPPDRLFKAVLCLNTNRIEEGLREVDWVLDRGPEGIAIERVHELRRALESRLTTE